MFVIFGTCYQIKMINHIRKPDVGHRHFDHFAKCIGIRSHKRYESLASWNLIDKQSVYWWNGTWFQWSITRTTFQNGWERARNGQFTQESLKWRIILHFSIWIGTKLIDFMVMLTPQNCWTDQVHWSQTSPHTLGQMEEFWQSDIDRESTTVRRRSRVR